MCSGDRAAASVRAPEAEATPETTESPRAMNSEQQRRLLLVIDDDGLMCDIIAVMAIAHGYDCLRAAEPETAERIMDEQAPEVIVLDMLMPGRDGIEWIRELAGRRSGARLILHSGCDRRVLESAAFLATRLGLRVLGILEKPFEVLDLVRLLSRDVSAPGPQLPHPVLGKEEIRAGILKDQLVVHFQPQVQLRDGRWIGMEALVRWRHPRHGLMLPNMFVGAAESSGLGQELTRKVLELALAGYRQIAGATGFDGRLSINLPGAVLIDLDFPEQVYGQVSRAGCDPCNIVFELAETAMVRNLDVATEVLTRMRLKGFSLSIDDFGTGYSPFKLLHQLPFNELKVETEFVQAAESDSAARAIVENSINLARQLGMASIAEGVETRDEWDWLRSLGCDRAQGHFIGRPVPAEDLIAWYRSRAPVRDGARPQERTLPFPPHCLPGAA